jgi:hypothetical protein
MPCYPTPEGERKELSVYEPADQVSHSMAFGVTMSPDAVLIFVVLTAMLTLLISLGHLAAQRCRSNDG